MFGSCTEWLSSYLCLTLAAIPHPHPQFLENSLGPFVKFLGILRHVYRSLIFPKMSIMEFKSYKIPC